MSACPCTDVPALELVDIIDMKWLLAGEGVNVHVERLQRDRAYAVQCLRRAAESPRAALRQVAGRMLELVEPTAAE